MARIPSAAVVALATLVSAGTALAEPALTETIVMIRHGEKPPGGLGQLSCQGLNRALSLGGVLGRMFGRPDAIFAPDPAVQKIDWGKPYDYVRPLATIEPAAIAFGLPVQASIGVPDVASLQHALEAPGLAGALVVVAWEHTEIVALTRLLLAQYGGRPDAVPSWDRRDYDGIYVVRLHRDGSATHADFQRQREGLDGQPAMSGQAPCPWKPPGTNP